MPFDFTAIWNAGGPVAVGFAAVIAAFMYDRRRPNDKGDAVDRITSRLDVLHNEVTDRLARIETKLQSQQEQINRMDRK